MGSEHPEPLSKSMREQNRLRDYLGDGAYVKYTGYSFVLYTSNGIEEQNHIELEMPAVKNLNRFITRMEGESDGTG